MRVTLTRPMTADRNSPPPAQSSLKVEVFDVDGIGGDSDGARVVGERGMPYRVTAFGTLVEGSWDELMALAKKCYTAVCKHTDRVILLIKLEEYAGRTSLMTETVERVEKRLGRSVKH